MATFPLISTYIVKPEDQLCHKTVIFNQSVCNITLHQCARTRSTLRQNTMSRTHNVAPMHQNTICDAQNLVLDNVIATCRSSIHYNLYLRICVFVYSCICVICVFVYLCLYIESSGSGAGSTVWTMWSATCRSSLHDNLLCKVFDGDPCNINIVPTIWGQFKNIYEQFTIKRQEFLIEIFYISMLWW